MKLGFCFDYCYIVTVTGEAKRFYNKNTYICINHTIQLHT